jgi:RecG-like helicase
MEKINKTLEIIRTVLSYNDKLLERVKVSQAILENVGDILTPGLKEDLKSIDSINVNKKREFLKIVLNFLEEAKSKYEKQTTQKQEETKFDLVQLTKLSIEKLQSLLATEKKAFKKIQVSNVRDALFNLPNRYEDRRIKKILKVKDGETGTFIAEVEDIKKVGRGKLKVEVILKQDNVKFSAFFTHDSPYLFIAFRKGKKVKIFGKVSFFNKNISIIQPEIFRAGRRYYR